MRSSDDAINKKHTPSFTDNKLCGNDKRILLSLPTKLVDLGIPEMMDTKFQNSSLLTEEHVLLIARQERTRNLKRNYKQHQEENRTGKTKKHTQRKLVNVRLGTNGQERRLNDIKTEKGASTWLITPLKQDEGYILNKREF